MRITTNDLVKLRTQRTSQFIFSHPCFSSVKIFVLSERRRRRRRRRKIPVHHRNDSHCRSFSFLRTTRLFFFSPLLSSNRLEYDIEKKKLTIQRVYFIISTIQWCTIKLAKRGGLEQERRETILSFFFFLRSLTKLNVRNT